MSKNYFTIFEEFIERFEQNILDNKLSKEKSGVVYTPQKIADYIVNNAFKFFLYDFIFHEDQDKITPDQLDLYNFKEYLNPDIKRRLKRKIEGLKILDPACGSGRFLIAIVNFLFKLIKLFDDEKEDFEIKKNIIQNNLYGIEIDSTAYFISKLRLLMWLYSENPSDMTVHEDKLKNLKIYDIEKIIDENIIDFNIYNVDFLFDFDLDKNLQFDFIIGNPPYIENKKIKDTELKKRIYKNFKSAYKLFDLSIIFLEKSLNIMKNNENSYLSFILSNKFLSADYGVKIREILLRQTELKEINNVSSLKLFNKTATYPIIITLKKGVSNEDSRIILKNYNDLADIFNPDDTKIEIIAQSLIEKLPSNVIPISGNIKLIQFLYSNFKTMSNTFNDLKILYRPFGFLKWAKHFENILEEKTSESDLILIGTGNVGKYHIKSQKMIKIAKQEFKVSYFKETAEYQEIWKKLACEKILVREIATELTCVYDPGVFTNITGLYFLNIPSFNTNELFSFLTIMNSNLLNLTFKTLFGTLHMSGGYMRFNGSFIKRLPMPREFPNSLNYIGRINQFLSQLIYDYNSGLIKDKVIDLTEVSRYSKFFRELANSLVDILFLEEYDDYINENYIFLKDVLTKKNDLPELKVKYNNPNYNLPKFEIYQEKERLENIKKISTLYVKLNSK